MEVPHYGRTGLLASHLGGLPVTRPRLFAVCDPVASSREVKWFPSLLTIPQQLLDALRREDDDGGDEEKLQGFHKFSADPSLVVYLRLASIAECLVQVWRQRASSASLSAAGAVLADYESPSRTQLSVLYAAVFQWCKEHVREGSLKTHSPREDILPPTEGTFCLPSYKLLVMKGNEKVKEYADITMRALWLLGKDASLNDIVLEHPSCSAQHASLEMRFALTDEAALIDFANDYLLSSSSTNTTHQVVSCPSMSSDTRRAPPFTTNKKLLHSLCAGMWKLLEEEQAAAGGDLSALWSVELQVIDLGSTNHTKLNGTPLLSMEATTVIESDVMEFGYSTRKYVLMRSNP